MKDNTIERCEDLKPEFTHYPDTGCDKAKEIGYGGPCLECIILPCLEDVPAGVAHFKKQARDREIIERRKQGESRDELASRFNVTTRTIDRAINGVC